MSLPFVSMSALAATSALTSDSEREGADGVAVADGEAEETTADDEEELAATSAGALVK